MTRRPLAERIVSAQLDANQSQSEPVRASQSQSEPVRANLAAKRKMAAKPGEPIGPIDDTGV